VPGPAADAGARISGEARCGGTVTARYLFLSSTMRGCGRVVLAALAWAAAHAVEDYGPKKRQQSYTSRKGPYANTVSKHDERVISAAFREEVVRGVGCWWEGDDWEAAAECCGCDTCNKRARRVISRDSRASARARRPRARAQAVDGQVLRVERPLGGDLLPVQPRIREAAMTPSLPAL